MRVPMLDLSEQYLNLKNEIQQKLDEVMTSTRFILGDNVKNLEHDIASYSNVKHGIGVGNGSDALHIALLACGIEAGDEVITTAFTFFATVGAIVRIGAKPVFADIDPITFNINIDHLEALITNKTKAIIPVHLYGQMSDMIEIKKLADQYNLHIIEDAAQAIGAKYKDKKVGVLGSAACYSFFPTKNLGAYGDAGMIVTDNDEIAEKSRILRVHGSKPKYHHHVLGYNSRLDELQAAILNVKFPYIDQWNQKRKEKAEIYTKLLQENHIDQVIVPTVLEGNEHVFHQYTLRVENRGELRDYLKESGIDSMVYYPIPLHLQSVFKDLGYQEGDLPETEKACNEVLSLPMFPELKLDQQQYVIKKVKEFYSNR